MGIGSILSIAGPVLGALGSKGAKGQPAQPTSGYETLPTEIKDYMMDMIFPNIKKYSEGSYQGLPKRRVNETDLDPVFGSTARRYMQDVQDREWLAKNLPNGQAVDPNAASGANAAGREAQDMEARMMARQYLQGGGGQQGSQGEKIKQMMAAGMYKPEAMQDIGSFLMQGEEQGYGSNVSGFGASNRNSAVQAENPEAYEKYGQAMNSYLANAAKAKGMI